MIFRKNDLQKVYLAQRSDPSEGDFCQIVDNDRQLLDIWLSDDQISKMSVYELKTLARKKAKEQAYKRLIAIKETKTKMNNISYTNSYQTQPYLKELTREKSSLLLALRTRSVRGIRSDFGDMFPCKDCPLAGCSQPDSLPHTLACQVLLAAVDEPSLVKYGDVFSSSVAVQEVAVSRFGQLLEARERILENQAPPHQS